MEGSQQSNFWLYVSQGICLPYTSTAHPVSKLTRYLLPQYHSERHEYHQSGHDYHYQRRDSHQNRSADGY